MIPGNGQDGNDYDEDDTVPAGPAWLGPKASEHEHVTRSRGGRGLSMRAVLPNAITAAALCSGLTSILFAVAGQWDKAVFAMIIAGVLDAMDGRVARLLKAQSRFGAELDSLADSASFGIAPALVLYLWSLSEAPRFGWLAVLAYAICCALRLARFNAQIDVEDQPHKSVGFLTGVPAPMGAGFAFMPVYLWLATDLAIFREPWLVGPWIVAIALLMVSNLATPSWKSLRPTGELKLVVIALAGLLVGGLLIETWWTLTLIGTIYLALIVWTVIRYDKIKRAKAEKLKPPVPEREPLAVDEVEQQLSDDPSR
ncbi:CDP-alcohol phosphatidyltransferase family protein [Erythrobacter sp. EC-HK427]|uniref:CDP-alcohol phosphatidyltransferase family protein n=2 Tax=Erythrobacter sp. EC-HK427 TaxID=2038396 RepID=UPI0012581AF4|nr:CDP-diacylglycerol--serine O-phosphatidyltransferase [Erythrobacter sp. EC-HK427]